MISIRCSELEVVRSNPAAFGQLLASNTHIGGGSHGMLACVQDVARLVHLGEMDPQEGIKELYNKFERFRTHEVNKARQEKLVAGFVSYCKQFDQREFVFIEGARLIKWDYTPEFRLSGRTPWVVANEEAYYGYFIVSNEQEWLSQLKYPLIQQYLSQQIINCSPEEVHVGIYSMAGDRFEFNCFSADEIAAAVEELGELFNRVQREYSKYKRMRPGT